MKKKYYFKNAYKHITIISFGGSVLGLVHQLLGGQPAFIIFTISTIVTYLQYRWRAKPYIEINGMSAIARFSWWSKARNINLKEVERLETLNDNQIILYMNNGEKWTIVLKQLTLEDKANILAEIPAMIN